MAREVTIKVTLDTKEVEAGSEKIKRSVSNALDAGSESMRRLQRDASAASLGINSVRSALSAATVAFTALGAAGVLAFERIGRAAVDAAINIDRQLSSLRALTGSAAEASKRFQELFKIAQQTPGLTTQLATTLDAQLRIFSVSTATINKLLPVVGRLNAISPLGDPRQFVNNLTQLISQNFERQDLKELVGASPIAGLLIKQIFNVDNPTNAEAIRAAAKRLGVTTVEKLAEELVKAADTNSALKNATETLGGQFEKLRDRLDVALAPIGEQIAKVILPVFDELVKGVEKYGSTAADVFRENKSDIIAVTRQLAAMTVEFTKAILAIGQLVAKSQIPEFLGRAAAESRDIIANPLSIFDPIGHKGPNLLEFERQLGVIEAERKLPRLSTEPTALSGFVEMSKAIADFMAGNKKTSATGVTGKTGSASHAARHRLAVLPLTASDLVSSELEGVDDFRAVAAARARGRELRSRLTLEADQATRNLLNEGRDTRRRLTAEADARAVEALQRTSRREFNRSGAFIQDAISRGQLTPGEAESLGQGAAGNFANQLREVLAIKERMVGVDKSVLDDLRDEIDLYDRLGTSISNTERFMRGFNSQIETVGDAFDRFGANVSRAFGNVRDLFNGLKSAVLGFFNDLVGNSLQNLVRSTLGPLLGGLGGALGGGNIFRTPSTFGNFAQAFAGGGISAPPSITATQEIQQVFSEIAGPATRPRTVAGSMGSTAAAAGVRSGFSLGGILGGLASSAPLLGLSLGSGFGGQSVGGQILGAGAGLAFGFGISGAAGILGAGGLAALGPAALAFLGPAAFLGAPLLIGSILLGKAKQRHQDEEASGEMIRQALQAIDQLAAGISSGSIDGSQARAIFENQILGQFRQQISGLKTRSVVESRLTNTVRDLRNVFEARIPPLIAQQEEQRKTAASNALNFSRQIPEFASGGIVPGLNRGFDSVRAMLTPGEMVLNSQQQSAIRSMAGSNVFQAAGVPGVNQSGRFAEGGIVSSSQGGRDDQPVVIDQLVVAIDAESIAVKGMRGAKGRAVTVNNIKVARTNREL